MQVRRPATLVQVAERAGVSLATASKVMNARGRISEATRSRVLQVARELDYRPDERARSLITGRTSTVGMIMIDSLTARFAVPVMLGAEEALGQIDLSLITSDARGDEGRLRELAVMLERRKVDGVIVIGDNNRRTPVIADLVSVPSVYVYGEPDAPGQLACITDDVHGGALVAAHLVGLGRTRIAHITGPRHATSVVDRVAGLRGVLGESGLRPVGGVRYGSWSRRWGRKAAERLLAERDDVDAIICGSDQIAAGVVDAVHGAGRRIPDDIAVTGYDDWDVFARDTDPELTSVAMDLEELGRIAARALFDAIDGGVVTAGTRRLLPTLVVRQSSVRSPGGSADSAHRRTAR